MPPLADGIARKKWDKAFGNALLGTAMRRQAVNIFINDHQGATCLAPDYNPAKRLRIVWKLFLCKYWLHLREPLSRHPNLNHKPYRLKPGPSLCSIPKSEYGIWMGNISLCDWPAVWSLSIGQVWYRYLCRAILRGSTQEVTLQLLFCQCAYHRVTQPPTYSP